MATEQTVLGEKWCYNDLAANCTTYGGLYEWASAVNLSYTYNSTAADSSWETCNPCGSGGQQGICPAGYHIPTDLEWSQYEYCIENTIAPTGTTALATFQTFRRSSWLYHSRRRSMLKDESYLRQHPPLGRYQYQRFLSFACGCRPKWLNRTRFGHRYFLLDGYGGEQLGRRHCLGQKFVHGLQSGEPRYVWKDVRVFGSLHP